MTPFSADRWRILSPYLDEALELPTAERAAWLASVGGRDAALADDLRAMLAEQDLVQESGFLEGAVLAPGMAQAQPLAGQVLGAYRLVSLIGQGGMGSVWLAERCDGRFEGRAAVKLLNVGLMGPEGKERFRREGTLLARVRHPSIAHLVDAGVSEAGQPYLVLEYVDGKRIDQYCDEHSLGVEARLRLFLDVLEAVAHAHANLVVHRRFGTAATAHHRPRGGAHEQGDHGDDRDEGADRPRRRLVVELHDRLALRHDHPAHDVVHQAEVRRLAVHRHVPVVVERVGEHQHRRL